MSKKCTEQVLLRGVEVNDALDFMGRSFFEDMQRRCTYESSPVLDENQIELMRYNLEKH